MSVRDLKSQLGTTLKAADSELKKRIVQAETTLSPQEVVEVKEVKPERKNEKLIKDTYALPESDCELIEQLRMRLATTGTFMNKTEILRAGLQSLAALSHSELHEVSKKVVRLKPGRAKS